MEKLEEHPVKKSLKNLRTGVFAQADGMEIALRGCSGGHTQVREVESGLGKLEHFPVRRTQGGLWLNW